MDILGKGTKVLMTSKSDCLTTWYRIKETDEIIKVGHLDDYEELTKGRDTELIKIDNSFKPAKAILVKDIPILDDYSDIDCRLVYKVGNVTYVSDRVVEVHRHYKLPLEIDIALELNLIEEAVFSKIDDEMCIVRTADGVIYEFDIL